MVFDPFNSSYLAQKIQKELPEVIIIDFRLTAQNYHPVMQDFDNLYLDEQVVFDHGDDCLLWCCENAILKNTGKQNYLGKQTPRQKIDALVAVLMSFSATFEDRVEHEFGDNGDYEFYVG